MHRGGFSGLCDVKSRSTDSIPQVTVPNKLQKPVPLVDLTLCTLAYSGLKGCKQEWYICRTCTKRASKGVCVACVASCHKGHDVVLAPQSPSSFFCDCGSGDMPSACGFAQQNLESLGAQEIKQRDTLLDNYYSDPDALKTVGVDSAWLAQGFDLDLFTAVMTAKDVDKTGSIELTSLVLCLCREMTISSETAKHYCTNYTSKSTSTNTNTNTNANAGSVRDGRSILINWADFAEEALRLQLKYMNDKLHAMFAVNIPQKRPLSPRNLRSAFRKGVITFEELMFMIVKQIGEKSGRKEVMRLRLAVESDENGACDAFNVMDFGVWYFTRHIGICARQKRKLNVAREVKEREESVAMEVSKVKRTNERPIRLARMNEIHPVIHKNKQKMQEYQQLYEQTALCSFTFTGRKGAVQDWGYCITCNGDAEVAICTVCALLCHRGHQLARPSSDQTPAKLFCDCGGGESASPCACIHN